MNLIKAALLLSAFVALSMAHRSSSESWDSWVECTHVGARAYARLLRDAIPTLRSLYECIDYEPILNTESSYLRTLKNLYELLRKTVYEKQSCLLDPLKGTANALMPFVDKIDALNCLA
ncbi:accessory gland protein Acp53Ea [Drosophila guanche]|uniref:Blast:Accessory gland protein Acp53Ea n=1 Tax=Drosophila guanche TaxID=7266 RepID=A0A3B0J1N3_DROGU|nr:accessory gland protein Acp53Ea [Drosophila guanche]SPP72792.1 blast:Accessory gland protein Acp53Ea [Drosophila guanche]